jgi:hypothetical protein
MRGTQTGLGQRRRRLIETIGKHAFEGREIQRRLGADREDRRALLRTTGEIAGPAASTSTDAR